jgi:Domain of unknown function (DUF4124)
MFVGDHHFKKQLKDASSAKNNGFLLVVVLFFATPMFSYGQVYKCADANGRVTIGDQPCVVKNASLTTTPKHKEMVIAPSKEPAQTEKEQVAFARDALEQKIQLKHSSECRDMRILLRKHGYFASDPLHLESGLQQESKLTGEKYLLVCLAQAKDVVILDQAQKESLSAEKARNAACDIKKSDYERRKKLMNSSSSDLEVNAFTVLQAEVLRGCR